MRYTRLVVCLCLLSGCSEDAHGVRSRAWLKSDLELMQGKWFRMVGDGKSLHDKKLVYVISGNNILAENILGQPAAWTFELNPDASPKRMDFALPDGKKILAIYSIQGGELTIHYFGEGMVRPKSFADPHPLSDIFPNQYPSPMIKLRKF